MSKLLNRHILHWDACTQCPISAFTLQKILCRGDVPCDILFVGEAPGDTEITLAKPFVGASGRLLNKVISEVRTKLKSKATCAFTNIIACGPMEDETLRLRPPSSDEIRNCRPRLQEFVDIAQPKVIVSLGNVAKMGIRPIVNTAEVIHGVHPAAVIRQGSRGALDLARLEWVITEAFQKCSTRNQ